MPTCTCIYRRMSEWSVFGCTETPQSFSKPSKCYHPSSKAVYKGSIYQILFQILRISRSIWLKPDTDIYENAWNLKKIYIQIIIIPASIGEYMSFQGGLNLRQGVNVCCL